MSRGSAHQATPRRPGCIRKRARTPHTVDWLRFSSLVPRPGLPPLTTHCRPICAQRHLSPVANASIAPDTAPKWPSAPDRPPSSVFLLRNTPKRLQLYGSRAAVGRAGRAGRPGTGDHRFRVLYPLTNKGPRKLPSWVPQRQLALTLIVPCIQPARSNCSSRRSRCSTRCTAALPSASATPGRSNTEAS